MRVWIALVLTISISRFLSSQDAPLPSLESEVTISLPGFCLDKDKAPPPRPGSELAKDLTWGFTASPKDTQFVFDSLQIATTAKEAIDRGLHGADDLPFKDPEKSLNEIAQNAIWARSRNNDDDPANDITKESILKEVGEQVKKRTGKPIDQLPEPVQDSLALGAANIWDTVSTVVKEAPKTPDLTQVPKDPDDDDSTPRTLDGEPFVPPVPTFTFAPSDIFTSPPTITANPTDPDTPADFLPEGSKDPAKDPGIVHVPGPTSSPPVKPDIGEPGSFGLNDVKDGELRRNDLGPFVDGERKDDAPLMKVDISGQGVANGSDVFRVQLTNLSDRPLFFFTPAGIVLQADGPRANDVQREMPGEAISTTVPANQGSEAQPPVRTVTPDTGSPRPDPPGENNESVGGPPEKIVHCTEEDVCCCQGCFSSEARNVPQGGDPVYLHSGEVFSDAVDLEIPGRGFNWRFHRRYRSQVVYNGPLGWNWDFNYNKRLRSRGRDLIYYDGACRAYTYIPRLDVDTSRPVYHYYSPRGGPGIIRELDDGRWVLRLDSGIKYFFHQLSRESAKAGTLQQIMDRQGNRMAMRYNDVGQLIEVRDTLGRPIRYAYNDQGRLASVTDFAERQLRFDYDERGDLVKVISPAITGTPHGNDFPEGRAWAYGYVQEHENPRVQHNMSSITAPNETATGGPARVTFQYDAADRITSQFWGGTNASGVPAGGKILYQYYLLPTPVSLGPDTARFITRVIDRNKNVTDLFFNQQGLAVQKQSYTRRGLRKGIPDKYVTKLENDALGRLTSIHHPDGSKQHFHYGSDSEASAEIHLAGPLGGDQRRITKQSSAEPIFGQSYTSVDPRGLDPGHGPSIKEPANRSQLERYTTRSYFDYQEDTARISVGGIEFFASCQRIARQLELDADDPKVLRGIMFQLAYAGIKLGLGDLNDDGKETTRCSGNIVRIERPSVALADDAPNLETEGGRLQPVISMLRYNDFGQLVSEVDAERNVTEFDYFDAHDPDGDGSVVARVAAAKAGGYLKARTVDTSEHPLRNSRTDPKPARIRNGYSYDGRGNRISVTDGRGIHTDYVYNQADELVQVVKAAKIPPSGPGHPEEPLKLVAFQYLERIRYDANGNQIARQVEDRGNTSGVGTNNRASNTAFADTRYKFDILDQQLEISREISDAAGAVTRFRYDPNGNQVLTILPEGNAMAVVYDARDLPFQSTRGAVEPPAGALLADADPRKFDVRGGIPATYTFHYDALGRPFEIVDAADTDGSQANNSKIGGPGDRTRFIYDGFGRQTSIVDAVGNQVVMQYDAAGNTIGVLRFGHRGAASPKSDGDDVLRRPVSMLGVVQRRNLVSTNLLSGVSIDFDELQRVRESRQLVFVNDKDKDDERSGAPPGPAGEAIPGLTMPVAVNRIGQQSVYDRSSRLIARYGEKGVLSRNAYDGAGRLIRVMDADGNSQESAYDGNGNLIERRTTRVASVEEKVSAQVAVSTRYYDSLNLLQKRVTNGGHTFEFRHNSRGQVVAVSDANGPPGPVINRRIFDGGPKTSGRTNRFGNVRLFYYDGQGRRIREESILTRSGQGDGVHIGADVFGKPADRPEPDARQGGGDGIIRIEYGFDRNDLTLHIIDDNGNQTAYGFDNHNRAISSTRGLARPDGEAQPTSKTSVAFDVDGNPTVNTDPNGTVLRVRFDAVNRPLRFDIERTKGVVGTSLVEFQYDGNHRTTMMANNNEPDSPDDDSVIRFTYDSIGRRLGETQRIGRGEVCRVETAWQSGTKRTGLRYPNGRTLKFGYDRLNRLATIADDAGVKLAEYSYIGRRVLERQYPWNGTRMSTIDPKSDSAMYDAANRVVALRHLDKQGHLLCGFQYQYDRGQNVLTTRKMHAPQNSETIEYDSSQRLIGFDRGLLANGTSRILRRSESCPPRREWVLDGVGNWDRVDAEQRSHSTLNAVTRTESDKPRTFKYDPHGNLIAKPTRKFRWDYRHRLCEVVSEDGSQSTYAYDALGRRILRTTGSDSRRVQTRFLYDGGRVIEERRGKDVVSQFVYGRYVDEVIAVEHNCDGDQATNGNDDERFAVHHDSRMSTVAVSDAAGKMREGFEYNPYGGHWRFTAGENARLEFGGDDEVQQGRASQFVPYLFAGRRWDLESETYFYRARQFDPELGRFISPDPLGYKDGLGAYEYVRSRPGAFVDPTGLAAVELSWEFYDHDNDLNASWTDSIDMACRKNCGNCTYPQLPVAILGTVKEHDNGPVRSRGATTAQLLRQDGTCATYLFQRGLTRDGDRPGLDEAIDTIGYYGGAGLVVGGTIGFISGGGPTPAGIAAAGVGSAWGGGIGLVTGILKTAYNTFTGEDKMTLDLDIQVTVCCRCCGSNCGPTVDLANSKILTLTTTGDAKLWGKTVTPDCQNRRWQRLEKFLFLKNDRLINGTPLKSPGN